MKRQNVGGKYVGQWENKAIRIMIGSGTPSRSNKMERMGSLQMKLTEPALTVARANDTVALAPAKGGAQTGDEGAEQQGNEHP